jgi:hypothetical protein
MQYISLSRGFLALTLWPDQKSRNQETCHTKTHATKQTKQTNIMRDSSPITTSAFPLLDFTNSPRLGPRRVCFTEYVEVNEYEPLNPELKSSLYYSREEMHEIQRGVKAAITLRRQRRVVAAKLATELQESVAFQDFLKLHSSGENKRVLLEEEGQIDSIPVPGAKRRRTV